MQEEQLQNLANKKPSTKKSKKNQNKKFGMGIVILLIFFGILFYQGRILLSGKSVNSSAKVKGEKTENQPQFSLPSSAQIRSEIEQKIEQLQNQASTLSPIEIATSSPQVQKILRDIKALEGYPRSQAREFCENLCKSL